VLCTSCTNKDNNNNNNNNNSIILWQNWPAICAAKELLRLVKEVPGVKTLDADGALAIPCSSVKLYVLTPTCIKQKVNIAAYA